MSVIIPTHLRPHLLTEAMDSVSRQSFAPAEMIVVDDAADRKTRTTIDAAAAHLKFPVRYVENRTPGVCHSRNLGARSSGTPWIAFLDDDDCWRPDFLAKLTARLISSNASLAISGIERHVPDGPPIPRVQLAGLTSKTVLKQVGSMTGSNFLIAKESFLGVGGFDASMPVYNDWDLFVRLVDAGLRYVVVAEVLAEWRDHSGERIATHSLRRADGLEISLDRYGGRLSRQVFRDIKTSALGIRRSHTKTALARLRLAIRLALAHGPKEATRRIVSGFRN